MKLSELVGRADLTEKFVLQKFLCLFLSCSREELWTTMDKEISDDIIQKVLVAYKSYVEDKKPLEYILGHVDFFGKEFFVNEATLIPRPETEYMITAVTEFISEKGKVESKKGGNLLLDIGTGCGVLGISVLLQNPNYFSQAIFTDYFANALEIAKRNYQTYTGEIVPTTLPVSFFQSDLLQFIESGELSPFEDKRIDNSNIVLVANLPYIPEEMFEENVADNVKKWEPKPAFVGGDDGLIYYRKMFAQIFQYKQDGIMPGKVTMFLEMMTRQVELLVEEFGEKIQFEEVKTFHFNIRILKAVVR